MLNSLVGTWLGSGTCCPIFNPFKTPVPVYQTTRHHISDNHNFNPHCHRNIKFKEICHVQSFVLSAAKTLHLSQTHALTMCGSFQDVWRFNVVSPYECHPIFWLCFICGCFRLFSLAAQWPGHNLYTVTVCFCHSIMIQSAWNWKCFGLEHLKSNLYFTLHTFHIPH